MTMKALKLFCQWLLRTRYPAVLVGLGLLMSLPSLWGGLQLDDFTIRAAVLRSELAEGVAGSPWLPFTFADGNPEHGHRFVDRGLGPWWFDPYCRASLLRPLTALTHIVDCRLWPNAPVLMHLQSLAWFALLIWAAASLYRRLMTRTLPAWIAALAALLFTLDDAHGVPVGWVANRNELLAALFGFLSLIAYDRWRRDGWRPGAICTPLALAAGLLAKETAASTGGYLLAYAVFLDGRGRPGRWISLLPCAAVAALWYLLYRGLGFGIAGIDVYADPGDNPIGFVAHVGSFGPILLWGQWGLPMSDVTVALSPTALRVYWLAAVVLVALLAALLAPLIARDPLARFWALGMLLSLLPICVAFPMDRLLMFVGLGAMGLLAQLLGGLQEGASWLPRRVAWTRPARVLGYVLAAVHLVVAPVLFLVSANMMSVLGSQLSRVHQTFPSDPELSRQTAVVVHGSWGATLSMIQSRDYRGEPLPIRILDMAPAFSSSRLTRTDARTLVVRPEGGYFPPRGWWPEGERPPMVSLVYAAQLLDQAARSTRNPLRLGETIELTTATIEVTELTPDGRPAEATFRFRVPLEDPSLRWLRVTRQGYVSSRPPAIGETVELPGLLSSHKP
jgi:hypothetical protein